MMRVMWLLLLSCLPLLGWAAEVGGLYEAEVVVADQGETTRRAALREGLAQVLVKVSGRSSAPLSLPGVLEQASRLVQQYRYQTGEAGAAVGEGEVPAQRLWMVFDPALLNRALRTAGQPVWGAARPLVLVWLAVEDVEGRRLVAAADLTPERMVLEAAGQRRGVPLRLPLLDLQEQQRVAPAEVWGGFWDVLLPASSRYNPQAIVVGRLLQDSRGQWRTYWHLRLGNDIQSWEGAPATLEAAVGAGVDAIADLLGQRFAQAGDIQAGTELRLRVHGVASLADYARTLAYLRSLNGVSAVQVVRVEADTAIYRLQGETGAATLQRTIALGSTLAPFDAVQSTAAGELDYRLLP